MKTLYALPSNAESVLSSLTVSQQFKQLSFAGFILQSLHSPFGSSVPHDAIANLLPVMSLALLDKLAIPVGKPS